MVDEMRSVPGYPIELALHGRTALVVGLGAVGRRKAAGLLAAGARVIGVDPWIHQDDALTRIELRSEPYHSGHLSEVALAIAAATPEVNRQVVADARTAGVWVCSASEPAEGDFTVPAVWRDGLLALTVSTTGTSPALAAALRDRAAQALGPTASGLVQLLAELRPEVLARLPDANARYRLFTDWADPRWLELWQSEGPDVVHQELVRRIDAEAELSGNCQTKNGKSPDAAS